MQQQTNHTPVAEPRPTGPVMTIEQFQTLLSNLLPQLQDTAKELQQEPPVAKKESTGNFPASTPEVIPRQVVDCDGNPLPSFILDNGKLDETLLGDYLRTNHPMVCINDTFYDADGMVQEADLRKQVLQLIRPYVRNGAIRRANSVVEELKALLNAPDTAPEENRIHFQNGTYTVNAPEGEPHFREEHEICRNRLPICYKPEENDLAAWNYFLQDLLEPEDIPTLQEYMGYCLVPTNKAQKMLTILGSGGEGKSRIAILLEDILGSNMNKGSITKLAANRFSLADQEGRLLMVDDDISTDSLKDTGLLKSMITCEGRMELERKGRQGYQGCMYTRLLGLGNGAISALYDRSEGFFRRHIILRAKKKRPDREDQPYVSAALHAEREAILNWMLEGLERLVANGYRFTISDRAKENLAELRRDANNVLLFCESSGYIAYEKDGKVTSASLYQKYSAFCNDNSLHALCPESFISAIKQDASRLGITYTNRIPASGNRFLRGFTGIRAIQNPYTI